GLEGLALSRGEVMARDRLELGDRPDALEVDPDRPALAEGDQREILGVRHVEGQGEPGERWLALGAMVEAQRLGAGPHAQGQEPAQRRAADDEAAPVDREVEAIRPGPLV